MEAIMNNFSWVRLVANVIQYGMWFCAANRILTRRYSLSLTILIEVLAFFPWFVPPALAPNLSVVRVLLANTFLVLLVVWIYKDRLHKKILVIIVILITMVMSELLFMIALPNEVFEVTISKTPIPYQIPVFSLYLACNALLLSLATMMFRRFTGRYSGTLSARELTIFCVFPITQYILLTLLFRQASMFSGLVDTMFLFCAVIFCTGADVALYSTMVRSAQNAELRVRNEMLEDQIASQGAHYTELASQYESIRHLRHDIENHVYTINILLKEGKTQEAEQYALELHRDRDNRARVGFCQNSVVDSFLYQRTETLAANGIQVDCNLSIPSDLNIKNTDLICAFGNLLDNAAEACQAVGGGNISILANYRKPYLFIETKNPVPPAKKKVSRITGLERGLGFAILNNLADRFDGQFTYEEADGIFHTSLILKEVPADASDCNL